MRTGAPAPGSVARHPETGGLQIEAERFGQRDGFAPQSTRWLSAWSPPLGVANRVTPAPRGSYPSTRRYSGIRPPAHSSRLVTRSSVALSRETTSTASSTSSEGIGTSRSSGTASEGTTNRSGARRRAGETMATPVPWRISQPSGILRSIGRWITNAVVPCAADGGGRDDAFPTYFRPPSLGHVDLLPGAQQVRPPSVDVSFGHRMPQGGGSHRDAASCGPEVTAARSRATGHAAALGPKSGSAPEARRNVVFRGKRRAFGFPRMPGIIPAAAATRSPGSGPSP